MASAEFTVNGLAVPPEVAVSASSTVTLALVSVSGVHSVAWSIIGNHAEAAVNPTIAPAGSPSGATATFAMPSGSGQAYLVQCIINGGVDESGQAVTNYTKTALVGVNSITTGDVPFVLGETFERSATHGYTEKLNNIGGSGGGTGDIKSDGSVAFAANQSMGSHKLTSLVNGSTGTQDAATVAQVEALIAASTSNVADWKQSVRAATTANITLSGAQTIDGVSVIAGDRVLCKDQTTASARGIYVCAAGAWSRATDADVSSEVTCGLTVLVEEGTANGGKPFILTTANPITLGSTSLTFTALSSATAGNGLTGSGTLSVLAENATIAVGAGGIKRAAISGDVTIPDGSNTAAITAGVIVAADLSALSITDIPPVALATTANVTLSGEQTIDGTLTSASRVLVWQQSTASQNGVYVTAAGAWARATDFDAASEFRPGVFFVVAGGTVHGGKLATLLTTGAITLGSTSLAFGLSIALPVSGTDDNKIAVGSSGQIVYRATTAITPDFGTNALTAGAATLSGAFQTTSYIGAGVTATLPGSGTWRTAHATTFKGRTSGGSTISIIDWGANTADNLLIGDATVSMTLDGASALTLKSGGTTRMTVGTNISIYMTRQRFKTGIGDCTFEIEGNATNSATAQVLNVAGQDLSGTSTTGGPVAIRPGTGTTAGGELYLASAAVTKRLRINDTGLGLYTAAPVAQQTRPGQLTGTFGSTGTALVDVTAAFDQTILNNNFRVLRDMCNSMESKLSQAAGGLGAWT